MSGNGFPEPGAPHTSGFMTVSTWRISMADKTHIEWTRSEDGTPGATWNPITGCSVVSPGCTNCYAMALAGTRLQHHPSRAGLTRPSNAGPVWTGAVRFNEQWLDQPLRWRRPRRIFVCAHGDLFHESVPDEWIDQVFAVMALAPQHIFQVLTKRAERMKAYTFARNGMGNTAICRAINAIPAKMGNRHGALQMPLPNVWLGVSAEDQTRADERIPHLLETSAAVRWVSAEPLLGPLDIAWTLGHPIGIAAGFLQRGHFSPGMETLRPLDWIVAGGESGHGARPMHPAWARSLRDQCQAAGIPFFFKQWGEWAPGENVTRQRGVVETADWVEGHWFPGDENLALSDGHIDDEPTVYRVGKKVAGALLDGREWREMPR
jgi:protein gp37